MKNLLVILGIGSALLAGCSSSSRTGYTYYDDVYDNRPSYAENKRSSAYVDDRPSYQQSQPSSRYQTEYREDERYLDDESQNSYGTYTERIRRFNSGSTGFDYYSPYYTGYNDGFNYGIGIGTGMGYSNFGRWGSSLWNPWYSSSFYFGWGRPSWSIGFNTWYTPAYFDPFWGNSWGWGRNNWYNPYFGSGWGSPWGWGGYGNHYHRNDNHPRNNNSYYGPRSGSYGNQYYNGNPSQGGRSNTGRGSSYGTPQPNNNGNMKYTPKSTPSPRATPQANPSPNRNQSQPNRNQGQQNIPSRYNQPSYSSPSQGGGNRSTPSGGGNSGGSRGSQSGGGSMQRNNK